MIERDLDDWTRADDVRRLTLPELIEIFSSDDPATEEAGRLRYWETVNRQHERHWRWVSRTWCAVAAMSFCAGFLAGVAVIVLIAFHLGAK